MRKVFYGWWVVFACFLIAFYVGGVVFYGFTAFFKPIADEFSWSYAQISVAASLRGLEMGIFAPAIGFLVDRFGSRKLALFGITTLGFGLVLLSLTNSLAMFYGGFVLIAAGASASTSTVLITAVANWFRRHVGKALGIMVCGFGAGGLLLPLIVRLIEAYQWQTTLIILGCGMWALGIPLSLVIRDRPQQYGYLPDGDVLPVEPKFAVEQTGTEIGFKDAIECQFLEAQHCRGNQNDGRHRGYHACDALPRQ